MGVNLIHELGRQFSPKASASHLAGRRADLPWRILRNGGRADRRVTRIADALSSSPSRFAASRNPEIYPHVIALATAGYDTASEAQLLFHAAANEAQPLPTRAVADYLRVVSATPRIYRRRGARFVAMSGVAHQTAHDISVFLPVPGLFQDVAPRNLSPKTRPETIPSPEVVDRAIDVMARFDALLAEDFQRTVRVVAFTTPLRDPSQWSYNLRLQYLGGVFIDPHPLSIVRLTEGLIHEFCHQRLWEWWAYEPPRGVDEGAIVRSPVTGRERTVLVMLHAMLIYAQLVHYHRFLAADATLAEDERQAAAERAAKLAAALPPTFALMSRHTRSRSRARRFVEFVEGFSATRDDS